MRGGISATSRPGRPNSGLTRLLFAGDSLLFANVYNGRWFPSGADKCKGIVNRFVTVLRRCKFADGLANERETKIIVADKTDDGQVLDREPGRGAQPVRVNETFGGKEGMIVCRINDGLGMHAKDGQGFG